MSTWPGFVRTGGPQLPRIYCFWYPKLPVVDAKQGPTGPASGQIALVQGQACPFGKLQGSVNSPGGETLYRVHAADFLKAVKSRREGFFSVKAGLTGDQVQPENYVYVGGGRSHSVADPDDVGNFGDDPVSFDHGMAEAAGRLREIETGTLTARSLGFWSGGGDSLPPIVDVPQTLAIDSLAGALITPHRLLLGDRLRLSVSYEEPAVEDREPFELDTLEAWSLRSRMVEHFVEDPEGWYMYSTEFP